MIRSGSSEMGDFYGCNAKRCSCLCEIGILEDPHNLLIFIAYLSHATLFHINKTQFRSQM